MKTIAIALAALALVGCARTMVTSGGVRVYKDRWADTTRELAFRAHADLGPCPQRQFTLMARKFEYPVRVAVEGCGLSGIYEHQRQGVVSHKHTATWVLTTRSNTPMLADQGLRPY